MEEKYEITTEYKHGTPVSDKTNKRLKLIVKIIYFLSCLALFVVGVISTVNLYISGDTIVAIVVTVFLLLFWPVVFLIYKIVKKMNPNFVIGGGDKVVIKKKK